MSNAAIGCLRFGARSERHTWPTASEYSFGSCSGSRDTFGLIPDVVRRSKMYNALRDLMPTYGQNNCILKTIRFENIREH